MWLGSVLIKAERTDGNQIPEDCKLKGGEAICFFSRGIDYTVYARAPEGNPYSDSKELGSRTIYEYKQNTAHHSACLIKLKNAMMSAIPVTIA